CPLAAPPPVLYPLSLHDALPIYYPPVLTLPLLAAERGFSLTFAMGGFSFGLLTGGLSAPKIGRLIDHYGGHRVMAAGAVAGALRSEEHTSELQSRENLVCRLLLE